MTLPVAPVTTNFSVKPTATSMRLLVTDPEAKSSSLVASILSPKRSSDTLDLEICATGGNRKPNDESSALSTAITERLNVADIRTLDCTNVPIPYFASSGGALEDSVSSSSANSRDSSEEANHDIDLEQNKPSVDRVVGTRTPPQQHQLEKVPASTDSSQDDMTLAEMETLIRRLAWQPPRSSNAMAPVTDRNLMGAATTAQDRHMQEVSTGSHSLTRIESKTPNPVVSGGNVTRTFVQVATVAAEILPTSLNRCVPLIIPVIGTLPDSNIGAVPESYRRLMNFPQNYTTWNNVARICFMCGNLRPCYNKRNEGKSAAVAFMHTSSKGICSSCEITAWTVVESKLQVKWCRECHQFCLLGSFASKRACALLLHTCVTCRERNAANRAKKKKKNANILKDIGVGNKENIEHSMGSALPSLKRAKMTKDNETSVATNNVLATAAFAANCIDITDL